MLHTGPSSGDIDVCAGQVQTGNGQPILITRTRPHRQRLERHVGDVELQPARLETVAQRQSECAGAHLEVNPIAYELPQRLRA